MKHVSFDGCLGGRLRGHDGLMGVGPLIHDRMELAKRPAMLHLDSGMKKIAAKQRYGREGGHPSISTMKVLIAPCHLIPIRKGIEPLLGVEQRNHHPRFPGPSELGAGIFTSKCPWLDH